MNASKQAILEYEKEKAGDVSPPEWELIARKKLEQAYNAGTLKDVLSYINHFSE